MWGVCLVVCVRACAQALLFSSRPAPLAAPPTFLSPLCHTSSFIWVGTIKKRSSYTLPHASTLPASLWEWPSHIPGPGCCQGSLVALSPEVMQTTFGHLPRYNFPCLSLPRCSCVRSPSLQIILEFNYYSSTNMLLLCRFELKVTPEGFLTTLMDTQ